MQKKICFLIFVIIIISQNTATAQVKRMNSNVFSETLLLTFEGNLNLPSTDYTVPKLRFGGGGALEFFLPAMYKSSFGLRLFGNINYIAASDSRREFYGQLNDFSTILLSSGGGGIFSYQVSNKLYPYFYLGLSRLWFDPKGLDGNRAPNNSKNLFQRDILQYDIMFGVKIPVSETIIISSGLGMHISDTDYLDDVRDGFGRDSYFTLLTGISFSFLGNRDNDKDGVLNSDDQCVDEPEDIDYFQDEDGCPDIDNDNDGIPDKDDKCQSLAEDYDGFEDHDGCPDYDNDKDGVQDDIDKCLNAPEDFDGFEDDDGCPELDNDKDGVQDMYDKCIEIAEDSDGFEDSDGCPDLDNDHDGLADSVDKCPDMAENINNYQDNDGCPDEVPKPKEEPEKVKPDVGVMEDISAILEETKKKSEKTNIPDNFLIHGEKTFTNNGTTINKGAYSELNKIISILKKNPSTKWQIEGYMDNKGNPEDLKKISEKRALAIYNYFIQQGLPSFMFKVVGYGDRNPIESNDKAFGRMRNRRIELKRTR